MKKSNKNYFSFFRENQSSILLILGGLDELPSSKLTIFFELNEEYIPDATDLQQQV